MYISPVADDVICIWRLSSSINLLTLNVPVVIVGMYTLTAVELEICNIPFPFKLFLMSAIIVSVFP
ncbi:MAG: hypothetical protein IJF83_06065 [Methanobrevibacter sp.]|nr:hypothetical protein [Methanobrevibacter sp.]